VETQRELAGLFARLGQLAVARGDLGSARSYHDKAFAIRQAIAEKNPDHIKNLRDVYRSITEFGHVSLLTFKNPEAARDYYRKALDGLRNLDERETSPLSRADVARGCYFLATALLRLNQVPEARKLYSECLEIRRKLAND